MLVGPLFHSTGISSVIEKTLNAEKICANYPLFLKEFSEVLVHNLILLKKYLSLSINYWIKNCNS